jgi:1-acyl-sn-glycerol-3-phosphate acyltransferase
MKIAGSTAVRFVRFLVHMFFRRVTVIGVEHVPSAGGGVLVAWHPNGLVDPALILATFPRQVVFGARHGLFKWPLIGQLMRAIGTVPIYRAIDVDDSSEEARRTANRRSLDAMARAVRGGAFATLFPEGISHDEPFPQELKTGAARLYYQARQLSGEDRKAPTIIPVGLHYSDKTSFRSEALVEFHPPMVLSPDLDAPLPEADDAALKERAVDLTVALESVLQEVTHAAETWELHRLMNRARSLTRAERAKRAGSDLSTPDIRERTLGMARVWNGYREHLRRDPDSVRRLMSRVAAYDASLRKAGLDDDDLDKPPPIESKWLPVLLAVQAAVVFLVLPPVLALGVVINAAPYFLTRAIARLAARRHKDTATVKLISGMVLFPTTWLLLAVLVALGQLGLHEAFPGIPRAPLAAGLSIILIAAVGGALGLIYIELVQRTWTSIKIRAKRRWGSSIVAQISHERAELFDSLDPLGEGMELPGHVRRDGRISATPEPEVPSGHPPRG